jgi:membrane-bound ClpP family serine protease
VNYLLDPNVSYFLLVSGLMLAVLALFAPGTGIIEVGALFTLALAGYGIANLPTNTWALVLMLVGALGFVLSLRFMHMRILLVLATLVLVIGSIFLFRQTNASAAINPVFATVFSIGAVGILWFMGEKGIDAMRRKPAHGLSTIVGEIGSAVTDISAEGTVYLRAENWSAHSDKLIRAGAKIKVIGRDGLVLMVEDVGDQTASPAKMD